MKMEVCVRISVLLTTLLTLGMALDAVTNAPLPVQGRYRDIVTRYARRFGPRATDNGRSKSWFCRRGSKLAVCRQRVSDNSVADGTPASPSPGKCKSEKCAHGTCVNGFCHCSRGWKGRHCDIDVDECLPTYSTCHHFCFNTPGSFRCLCRDGYKQGNGGRYCVWSTPRKWRKNFPRSNRRSYRSFRAPHFLRRRLRLNIPASESNTVSQSPQRARPTPLLQRASTLDKQKYSQTACRKECSYKCIREEEKEKCICPRGFSLGSNERSCIDRNECLDGSGVRCPTNKKCRNTVGSFTCVCRSGYTASYRRYTRSCGDVNECLTGEHKCGRNSVCHNTIGSYVCNCLPGYLKAGEACIQLNRTWLYSADVGRDPHSSHRSLPR